MILKPDFMKTFLAALISLALACLLTACKIEVPDIATASVTRYSAGAPGTPENSRQLTPEQRAALLAWFKQHPSGWAVSHGTYAPALEASLTHENGAASVVNVLPAKVVVYGGFGQYERRTNKQAIAALQKALGATGN
jgi:hypothetical protein